MEWKNEDQEKSKKGMSLSTKVLLALIVCIILMIILIILLLSNKDEEPSYKTYLNGKVVTIDKNILLTEFEGIMYANIQEFSKLVGYEYHDGEYKAVIIEKDKCNVQGANETASFYLNENKVYKTPLNEHESDYEEYAVDNPIKVINEKMYAPLEAIKIAFNVLLEENGQSLQVYTLDYLISMYDTKVTKWGYQSIKEQSIENKKTILYGCLIVKKDGGLYQIIDLNNTKEIVPAKYTSIDFLESIQGFLVKNNSNQVGIVDINGAIKLDLTYEQIAVLDKESDLYLVKQSGKYGVAKGNNSFVIFPEYDSIGIKNKIFNKNIILDTLIPVCKEKKWGAYNKEGRLVLNIEYDGLGFENNIIEINGIKESVEPVLSIERANAIIVQKEGKYGLIDVTGKEFIPIAVDGIYAIKDVTDEDAKYFMLYNGNEINVIERLIKFGYVQKKEEIEEDTVIDNSANNVSGNVVDNQEINNQLDNKTNITNEVQ